MPRCVLDESMPCDSLKSRLERQFLAGEGSLDDDVDISQQMASLSLSDCTSIVMQLLTYFDASVSQLKHQVSFDTHLAAFFQDNLDKSVPDF